MGWNNEADAIFEETGYDFPPATSCNQVYDGLVACKKYVYISCKSRFYLRATITKGYKNRV